MTDPASSPAVSDLPLANESEILSAEEIDAAAVGILDPVSLNPAPELDVVPNFAQEGYACIPASGVSALYIWDRLKSSTELLDHALSQLDADKIPWEQTQLDDFRARLGKSGIMGFDDASYKDLSLAYFHQFLEKSQATGLDIREGERAVNGMGLEYVERGYANSFSELWRIEWVKRLRTNDLAQFIWHRQESPALHAFLVGRVGATWFLYDQGGPYRAFSSTLDDLEDAVVDAVGEGDSRLDIFATASKAAGTGAYRLALSGS